MTGFIPTYLSSTTSRAKSSFSEASVIAAPPYLITTVLPWNSRIYGSASSRVATSRTGRSAEVAELRRVFGIERDVFVSQVGEEPLGLRALAGQVDLILDLVALHGRLQRLGVVRHLRAACTYRYALDRHA